MQLVDFYIMIDIEQKIVMPNKGIVAPLNLKDLNNNFDPKPLSVKSANDEAKIMDGCQDCINKKYTKVELECKHTCCSRCIIEFAGKYFLEGKPYEYLGPCAICNKNCKIGKFNSYLSENNAELFMLLE